LKNQQADRVLGPAFFDSERALSSPKHFKLPTACVVHGLGGRHQDGIINYKGRQVARHSHPDKIRRSNKDNYTIDDRKGSFDGMLVKKNLSS